MRYEIYNNGNRMLSSNDSFSIPIIWKNILGINAKSQAEHEGYLRFLKSRGFTDGEIELIKDKVTIDTAELKLP